MWGLSLRSWPNIKPTSSRGTHLNVEEPGHRPALPFHGHIWASPIQRSLPPLPHGVVLLAGSPCKPSGFTGGYNIPVSPVRVRAPHPTVVLGMDWPWHPPSEKHTYKTKCIRHNRRDSHVTDWKIYKKSLSFNPFSAGTVFIRQNLTSADVRFSRIKTFRAPKKYNIYNGRRPITLCIQINRKS